MKFSEILVIAMAIAGLIIGGKWYIDYRHSASFALTEFIAAVKGGNVGSQYALIDEADKKAFLPTKAEYVRKSTLSHGYTERIENSTLGPEAKDAKNPDKVTIPLTTEIRATSGGKQLYETGQKQTYSDKIVMKKGSDGNWRLVLSESVDKSTGRLHIQDATPSPNSDY